MTRLPHMSSGCRRATSTPVRTCSIEFSGGIVLDADGAMGQVAGPHAVRLGDRGARAGAASVLIAVQACGHLGALGFTRCWPPKRCVLHDRPTHAAARSPGFSACGDRAQPDRFRLSCPRLEPIVFDIACSVAARGHILLAAREGRPIPEGWALDAQAPTTDSAGRSAGDAAAHGRHKGIGIAMMVECLAGALAATAEFLAPEKNIIRQGGAVGR